MRDFTFQAAIAAIVTLSIVATLEFAAIGQGNHDALVALMSVLTGAGLGGASTLAIVSRPKSPPAA